MFAARRLATRSAAQASRQLAQCRSATTVPRAGTEEAMKADALEQIRARLAYQKELKAGSHAHTHDEEVNEMWKWIKISFMVGLPICILSGLKDIFFGEHHHDDGSPKPEYMKIRTSSFPWECEDCALFDQKCWNACRAEKLAGN